MGRTQPRAQRHPRVRGHPSSTVHAGHTPDATVHAPCPAVLGDALRLPFRDGTFEGAAALWMLYHLTDPVHALLEAHRVLRSGGLLAVSTVSRHNDPELAPVLPDWGKPLSFDAENAPEQLSRVFDLVDVQSWDRPMAHLADRAAATLHSLRLTAPRFRPAPWSPVWPSLRMTAEGRRGGSRQGGCRCA
ncbi:class I SAM-dependent methyltransferase [Streptomyces sp. NPDC001739]